MKARKIASLLGILFFISTVQAQYFKVEVVSEMSSWMTTMVPDTEPAPPYHKIMHKEDDSQLGFIVYPPYSEKTYSATEKIEMIEELLKYKGDTRKCFMKIKCSKGSSYEGKMQSYSIQVEALYIINTLFFSDYTQFSPCPILVDDATKEEATVEGAIVDKAFAAYEAWFAKVKAEGFGKTLDAGIKPWDGSGVSWCK